MRNKYIFVAVLLAALTVLGAGFVRLESGESASAESAQEQLHIVTSFYPMYIAAINIAGDIPGVDVSNLTEPQTGCLHDYQLTPQDMILLSEADIFIVNGGGIESFLDDVTENYPDLAIVTASEGVSYLGADQEFNDHVHESGHEEVHYHGDGHDHGDINAHVWMDVERYMQEVQIIAEAFQNLDAGNKEAYRENASVYLTQLKELKEEFAKLESVTAGKSVIIFHDSFSYLADAVGLDVAGVIAMDGETSFSANQVSEIVEIIKEKQVDMLFTEEQYGTLLADAVARETSANMYVLDSLVTGEDNKDSYILGMKQNLEMLKTVLGKGE